MKAIVSGPKDAPLVSICIPTFNGSQYLSEALASVNEQTYSNLELIISDDHSTDNTLSILDSYSQSAKYPIKIFNHKPEGIAANWNNCLRKSNGKYIKFLFQDDILKPECISQMVKVLENDIRIALVASKRDIITDLNNRFSQGWIKNFDDLQKNLNLPKDEVAVLNGKDILKSPYFKKKPINIIGEPVAVLFRRDLIQAIGFFDNDMFQLVDYEYWLRMFKNNKIAFITRRLVQFRLHDNQASF